MKQTKFKEHKKARSQRSFDFFRRLPVRMAKIPILPGTNPKIQNLWFTCNRRIAGVSAITRRVINGCVSALTLLVRSNVDAATTQPAIEDRVNACQNGIPPSIPLPPCCVDEIEISFKSASKHPNFHGDTGRKQYNASEL